MFRRYGNPEALLRLQTLKESLDFFFYLLDEEDKDELTRIWLSKDFEIDLPAFLKKYSKKRYIEKREQRVSSKQEEEMALARAEAILNLVVRKEENGDGAI